MLWHQSLKSTHYRTLLIFQNKKNRFQGQNMGGGDKRHVMPPCQNMGVYILPIPPPGIYALDQQRKYIIVRQKLSFTQIASISGCCQNSFKYTKLCSFQLYLFCFVREYSRTQSTSKTILLKSPLSNFIFRIAPFFPCFPGGACPEPPSMCAAITYISVLK